MKERYILRNHNTGEEIDLGFTGDNFIEVYEKARKKAGLDKIYYTRHTILETGEIWVDFGSYVWFIYIRQGKDE